MVYESDFYTTRRPYRASPAYSTYTTSFTPSRQIRILPGLGKVHVVHSYERIVPYVGHKRLTVVTTPPKVYSTRSSVLRREYDWIENKLRPWVSYSPTNRYLNSDSAVRIVYSRNPITDISYDWEYNPKRYYSNYRIVRPLTYFDEYWPYYKSLGYFNNYWPPLRPYRYLPYIDDVPVYRSLRLQRNYYDYPLYRGWYNYYNNFYNRWYRPLSLYWPLNNYRYDYYYPYSYYNNYWYKNRSYYWSKYLPLSFARSSNYAEFLKSIFDDETRLIRAETASLLKRIHSPVPRIRTWPITPLNRLGEYSSLPVKYSNDTYIHRLLTVSPNSKVEYATYYTEPVRKYIGDRGYSKRRQLAVYEDPVKNDIQLLSYYINKFRQEKSQPKEVKAPLSSSRPSRIFSIHKPVDDAVSKEIHELREARAARLARIYDTEGEDNLAVEKKKEEARLKQEQREREEKEIVEAKARKDAQAKKEEALRKAELARQEELAAQAAADHAAELEKQAEQAKQEEIAKKAELKRIREAEEERARLEDQRRLEEEARAEEERQQLLRLEEIARQAEAEKEAELARQADELAELARQEAELAELERQERELLDQQQKEAELAELARQEAELAELERQEAELTEQAAQAKEEAEAARKEAELAELAKQEAELAELERQEAELAELERQQAELDALDAEARALEESNAPAAEEEPEVQEEAADEEAEEEAQAEPEQADEEEEEEEDEE